MAGAGVAKVVQRCLTEVVRNPPKHVDLYVGDDLTLWHVALHYPPIAPFIGGPAACLEASGFTLYASLRFHEQFPARPPQLKFLSPWMNHQHLWGNRICHSLLSDDFLDFFHDRRIHGTSMWNASCALADAGGAGGMSRYLQILRDFLSTDPDYDEEQHVKYDLDSLADAVEAQKQFWPEGLEACTQLELTVEEATAEGAACRTDGAPAARPADAAWGTDFFRKEVMLTPGITDNHPCFDVTVRSGGRGPPQLLTNMTSLCRSSFDLGARTSDFGTHIVSVLPQPCSRAAWATAGSSLARQALQECASVVDSWRPVSLPCVTEESQEYERILNFIGEIWKVTCIDIVKEDGYESERAMMCFVSLHFLALCLAEDHPGLRGHAAASLTSFLHSIQSSPGENLKSSVPDLGRFLVRFLLTADEVPLQHHARTIVQELLSRNVTWVDPDLWPAEGDPADVQEEQIAAFFEKGQFGMKLTVFQCYYIIRSNEFGLDTLEALEACGGRPDAKVLRAFQQDCKEIKRMSTFKDFFLWLQLHDMMDADIHRLLCEAVDDSEERGYNLRR